MIKKEKRGFYMALSIMLMIVISFGYPVYRIVRKSCRLLMIESDISYKILSVLDSIFDWLKKNIQLMRYFFFSVLFIGITYLQKVVNSPIYDLKNKSLIEVLGLSIAILSLYGIYIGFLQYITDHNEGNMFLGKSKVNYLIDNSIWYQITQSRFFLFSLIIAVFVPLFLRLNISLPRMELDQSILELSYIWQTTIILLLVIYLFLLRMSIEIIYITLLMKIGSDSGLQAIMKREIKEAYEQAFWKSYNIPYNYSNLIENMLSRDLKKLKSQEIDEYVVLAFEGIDTEFLVHSKKKIWKKDNVKRLSDFHIRHLQRKWEFLTKMIDDISYTVWRDLLSRDIQHINYFEEELGRRLIIPNSMKFFEKYVTEYLFDQMLKKVNSNIQDIIIDTEISTKALHLFKVGELEEIEEYKLELEKYKWKEIFSSYHSLHSKAKLPKLKKEIKKEYSDSESP